MALVRRGITSSSSLTPHHLTMPQRRRAIAIMVMVVVAAAAEDGHRPIRTMEAWQYIITSSSDCYDYNCGGMAIQ
jgi:hypothetical protein